jgi:hypothetical protein
VLQKHAGALLHGDTVVQVEMKRMITSKFSTGTAWQDIFGASPVSLAEFVACSIRRAALELAYAIVQA